MLTCPLKTKERLRPLCMRPLPTLAMLSYMRARTSLQTQFIGGDKFSAPNFLNMAASTPNPNTPSSQATVAPSAKYDIRACNRADFDRAKRWWATGLTLKLVVV